MARLFLSLVLLGACGHEETPTVEVEPEQALTNWLAVGSDFSCAIHFGQVWCWGLDPGSDPWARDFEVGEVAPRRIVPLDGSVELAAQDRALCARKRDGTVWCWGIDLDAERPRAQLSRVPELEPSRALALHAGRLCGIKDDQAVRCFPESGEQPWTERIEVAGAQTLHGGEGRICARDHAGSVRCWQRAEGPRQPPVPVEAPGARSVAADPYCAVTDGRITCGRVATRTPSPGPLSAVSAGELVFAEVGTSATGRICGLVSGGNLYCWALPAAEGNAQAPGPTAPPPDPIARDVVSFALGPDHVCATLRRHKVVCSGDNTWGEVGQPRHVDRRPVQVSGLRNATDVAVGRTLACALREGGSVWCWGSARDASGQVLLEFSGAAELSGLPAVDHIGIVADTLYARTTDGRLFRWGAAVTGREPEPVPGIERANELGASRTRVCVRSRGEARCLDAASQQWASVGALGGTTGLLVSDTAVCGMRGSQLVCDGATDVVPREGAPGTEIYLGGEQVCAVDRRGVLRCAGHNGVGQLGQPPSRPISQWTEVEGLVFVTGVALGRHVSCFWQTAGPLHCAGLRPDTLVPRGTSTNPFAFLQGEPVDRGDGSILTVNEVRNVRSASVGATSCAVTRRGEVWCWGLNDAGQHGMGNPRHIEQMTEVDLPAASPVPAAPGLFF